MKTYFDFSNARKINLARLPYYLRAVFHLVKSVKWKTFISLERVIYLRKYNLVFKIITLLDILTLEEVVVEEEYESLGVKVSVKDKIIVDIGAGFGDFSILMAKKYPFAKIYAFEPDRRYFLLLKENLIFNKVNNVIIFKKPVQSLRQIFRSIQPNPISYVQCDFMKMDCEGCEFDIINEKDLVYLKRIKKLVMEYHEDKNHKVEKLKAVLGKAKFKIGIYPRQQVDNIGLLAASIS